MKKTTINIQHEANIKAKGVHTQKNSKSVICLETGEVWASVLDTANDIGSSPSNLIACLQGKTRTCKGKHYCYLSRVNESLDAIVTRLRETAAVEDAAKKWIAYEAEQEAIRIAEAKRAEEARIAKEKHDEAIAKAKDKIARRQAIRDRIAAQLAEADQKLMEAEKELDALEDDGKEVA